MCILCVFPTSHLYVLLLLFISSHKYKLFYKIEAYKRKHTIWSKHWSPSYEKIDWNLLGLICLSMLENAIRKKNRTKTLLSQARIISRDTLFQRVPASSLNCNFSLCRGLRRQYLENARAFPVCFYAPSHVRMKNALWREKCTTVWVKGRRAQRTRQDPRNAREEKKTDTWNVCVFSSSLEESWEKYARMWNWKREAETRRENRIYPIQRIVYVNDGV